MHINGIQCIEHNFPSVAKIQWLIYGLFLNERIVSSQEIDGVLDNAVTDIAVVSTSLCLQLFSMSNLTFTRSLPSSCTRHFLGMLTRVIRMLPAAYSSWSRRTCRACCQCPPCIQFWDSLLSNIQELESRQYLVLARFQLVPLRPWLTPDINKSRPLPTAMTIQNIAQERLKSKKLYKRQHQISHQPVFSLSRLLNGLLQLQACLGIFLILNRVPLPPMVIRPHRLIRLVWHLQLRFLKQWSRTWSSKVLYIYITAMPAQLWFSIWHQACFSARKEHFEVMLPEKTGNNASHLRFPRILPVEIKCLQPFSAS